MSLAEILALFPIIHIVGAMHALDAVMRVRTSQGAIAWGVSLVTFPYLSIPLYWVFGRTRFTEYVETLREARKKHQARLAEIRAKYDLFATTVSEPPGISQPFLERLSLFPFSRGNKAEILIDGEETFGAIFEALRAAEHYILLQSYIIRSDGIGGELKEILLERAKAGVRICCLFDSIGSISLADDYVDELTAAGISVSFFRAGRRWLISRARLNFRNHRKTVIVDGKVGFIGGSNVGDEYMGRSKVFGKWRDTHLRVTGPGVVPIQIAFSADWAWMTGESMEFLRFGYAEQPENQAVLTVPTGPSDDFESASLMFSHLINAAQKRIWLATPYFVPDAAVMSALHMAALRGVEVRVLIPGKPDHLFVYLAGLSACSEVCLSGLVRVFQYQDGFMHQKTALFDSHIAIVGTANLDNRSFRLNFETSTIVADRAFAGEMERMLLRDFDRSKEFDCIAHRARSVFFHMAAQTARLLSPIL